MSLPIPSTNKPPVRVVFMSTFVPRECGLATFTEDVLQHVAAQGAKCKAVAMNRPKQQKTRYDQRVLLTVQEDNLHDYLCAASAINKRGFDVLSLQHEFGIFGGEECDHLASFLDAVEIPVVTTLHTVLRKPSPAMRKNLRTIADRSDAIVVMNGLAIELLERIYGIDPHKVHLIHHGAPTVERARLSTIKHDLKLAGKKVISTFGLLSTSKGLEYAVRAIPRIVEEHPEAVYLILGQTHPVVKQQEGEKYRDTLKALAKSLGVEDHVIFVDKYFTKAELVAYLLATDIYLTPYLNMEQVTSGTLAYAMACGRPLVSTPYLYAQFLIGEDDRGLLVPPGDPDEIAEACLKILDNPRMQSTMERVNWRYGQSMLWPRVGSDYLRVFQHVTSQQSVPATYLRAGA